jgi:hypothetical protein
MSCLSEPEEDESDSTPIYFKKLTKLRDDWECDACNDMKKSEKAFSLKLGWAYKEICVNCANVLAGDIEKLRENK